MNDHIFQQISVDLTGEEHLPAQRGGELLERLRAVADGAVLDRFARVAAALPPSGPDRQHAIRSQLFGVAAERAGELSERLQELSAARDRVAPLRSAADNLGVVAGRLATLAADVGPEI